jgi:hypothetical protein
MPPLEAVVTDDEVTADEATLVLDAVAPPPVPDAALEVSNAPLRSRAQAPAATTIAAMTTGRMTASYMHPLACGAAPRLRRSGEAEP